MYYNFTVSETNTRRLTIINVNSQLSGIAILMPSTNTNTVIRIRDMKSPPILSSSWLMRKSPIAGLNKMIVLFRGRGMHNRIRKMQRTYKVNTKTHWSTLNKTKAINKRYALIINRLLILRIRMSRCCVISISSIFPIVLFFFFYFWCLYKKLKKIFLVYQFYSNQINWRKLYVNMK